MGSPIGEQHPCSRSDTCTDTDLGFDHFHPNHPVLLLSVDVEGLVGFRSAIRHLVPIGVRMCWLLRLPRIAMAAIRRLLALPHSVLGTIPIEPALVLRPSGGRIYLQIAVYRVRESEWEGPGHPNDHRRIRGSGKRFDV